MLFSTRIITRDESSHTKNDNNKKISSGEGFFAMSIFCGHSDHQLIMFQNRKNVPFIWQLMSKGSAQN